MTADAGGRAEPGYLVVGHITKAHGTRGELFVWPLTDRPDDVFAPGRELVLGDEDGTADDESPGLVVEGTRPFKRGLLVRFHEIGAREDADALAQRYLLLPADEVPPLEEGEVFYHDLLGIAVETKDGVSVGTVREVYETEPHHLLEVASPDGRKRLVPFAARIVIEIDVAARRLVIDPPEGMLDL